ncbi:hypothetical protein ACFSUS_15280 [Spirosoma soli]|uniref:DUF1772 domain-containing protein n=1 Tax=Spirosoma soli TaxID=1770529 RepID=A0ABW5M4Y0_9BACT
MAIARVAVDFGLVVLIWFVQLIIYPSFRYYNPADLAIWHPKYTNLITLIVGPLMLAQILLVGWELTHRFSWLTLGAAVVIAGMWASTAFQAVPIHNAIAAGDTSSETLDRLVRVNWVRTVGWTVILILSVVDNIGRKQS